MNNRKQRGLLIKRGFTLAEVLVTLGIIGVVCALTLPSLVEKHQKQATITKLKKIYSVLSQQIMLANSQTTPANEFLTAENEVEADKTEEFFQTYWVPYFKGVTILNSRPYSTQFPYKYMNGDMLEITIKTGFSEGRITFSTSDGFIFFICVMKWKNKDENGNLSDPIYSSEMNVYIDINGLKHPNTLGKDIFRVTMNYKKIMLCHTALTKVPVL